MNLYTLMDYISTRLNELEEQNLVLSLIDPHSTILDVSDGRIAELTELLNYITLEIIND